MFNNIGKKIKTLVMVVFVLGCIGAVITMILIWMSIPSVSRFNSGAGIFTFFGGLIAGALLFLGSWIGSFFLWTCKNCGCENSGDSIFCTSCGERK